MPEYSRGIKWNDPIFNISWPIKSSIISKKDSSWKLLEKETDDGQKN